MGAVAEMCAGDFTMPHGVLSHLFAGFEVEGLAESALPGSCGTTPPGAGPRRP